MVSKIQDELSATLVHDLIKEKRADRRWRNVRFICWFGLFLYWFIAIWGCAKHHPIRLASFHSMPSNSHGYVALLHLEGVIAPDKEFSGYSVIPLLKEAFSDKGAKGVVLHINSPGGTPVQAAIIHDAIISLKKRYHKPVIVVGEDMLTSGAYYVAVAADKIYVNPNTITGSVGVIMKGFGFVQLMKKIGIERRVYAIGSDKDRLDPFLPQNAEDLKKINQVMHEVHQNFVAAVLAGRKGKLKDSPSKLFTGDFWSGQTAFRLGLVDGLGNLLDVMDKEFHTTTFKEYDHVNALFKLLSGQLNTAMDTVWSNTQSLTLS